MRSVICLLTLIGVATIGKAQEYNAVSWQFETTNTGYSEITLKCTASMRRGWHLYSQHLSDDGPMPTRLSFVKSDAFVLIGQPEENGHPFRFHDDTYGMDIIWYSDTVSFIQNVKLVAPTATLKGTIEYMSCNDHTCIPGRQEFSVGMQQRKKPL